MMFRRFSHILATAVLPIAAASGALAQDDEVAPDADRFAVGAVVGTRGLGIEVQYAWSDQIVLRGTVDSLVWQVDGNYRGSDYVVDIAAPAVGAFVDLHPFRNGFLVSGGVYLGEPEVDLRAIPRRAVRLGGTTFTPAQVGQLYGSVMVNGTAPFVGLGYDATFSRNARWGVRAVAGATFTGTPRVRLTSRGGTLSSNRAFQVRLAREVKDLEAEISAYSVFPVAQIGLNYRF